jgi:hypothetical protein
MNPRLRRIGRILEHRQKELDDRVAALSEVKGREARARTEADLARARQAAAETSRRELAARGSDAQSFMEAEEWLATATTRSHMAWAEVLKLRQEVSAVQATVMVAKMKLRQAEQLSARVTAVERKVADQKERKRDDEVAARIAQRRTSVAGSD